MAQVVYTTCNVLNTVHATKALLADGWAGDVRLVIDGGAISEIAAGVAAAPGDTPVGVLLPGLVNAHSHAFQRALTGHTEQRGPAGRDDFWTWRDRMYRLAAAVDAAALKAIAREAYVEMLEAGYTSVAEFHYLHDEPGQLAADDRMFRAIGAAARDVGIRLTYVPVLYERAGFADDRPSPAQARFAMSCDEFLEHHARATAAAGGLLSVGIGAHSLRAVAPESLARIVAARAGDAPLHIHVAEQQREVDECLAARGRRPVRWLLENQPVDEHWCLVHATHMDADETRALAATGAVVCLCPSTEANLGDGLFPLRDFLAAGGRIAIGSDSHTSINPFEELRWLEYGQRLATQTRNVAALDHGHVGSELYARVLAGGAGAVGRRTAGLAAGAPADLVALYLDDPMLLGHGDATRLDALVFSGFRLPIERVMVAGDWRVVDGDHVERDLARRDYANALDRIGITS